MLLIPTGSHLIVIRLIYVFALHLLLALNANAPQTSGTCSLSLWRMSPLLWPHHARHFLSACLLIMLSYSSFALHPLAHTPHISDPMLLLLRYLWACNRALHWATRQSSANEVWTAVALLRRLILLLRLMLRISTPFCSTALWLMLLGSGACSPLLHLRTASPLLSAHRSVGIPGEH